MKRSRDPLPALQKRFHDEAKCRAVLERARWPRGPVCPRCGAVNHVSRISTRPGTFACLGCGSRFSVTAGTAMHNAKLPSCTWLIAAHLMAADDEVSVMKLSGTLGLQYRTTWHLVRRLREMMASDPRLFRRIAR